MWNDLQDTKPSKLEIPEHPAAVANDQVANEQGKALKRGRRVSVIDRTLADPYHALLFDNIPMDNEIDYMGDDEQSGEECVYSPVQHTPNSPHCMETTHRAKQPSLDLLVGNQDLKNPYFTRRLRKLPASAGLDPTRELFADFTGENEGESSFQLTDLDPHALKVYRIWVQTGTILIFHRDMVSPSYSSETTWQACWPLMNAIILGDIVEEHDFVDELMNLLDEKVIKKVCADADTITHIFANNNEKTPEVLKRFVMDRCFEAQVERLLDLHLVTLPTLFLARVLERMLGESSGPERWEPLDPDCTYHSHESVEDCYKRKSLENNSRHSAEEQENLAQSPPGSEDILADTDQQSFKSVDRVWGDERADRVVSGRAARREMIITVDLKVTRDLSESMSTSSSSATSSSDPVEILPTRPFTRQSLEPYGPHDDILTNVGNGCSSSVLSSHCSFSTAEDEGPVAS